MSSIVGHQLLRYKVGSLKGIPPEEESFEAGEMGVVTGLHESSVLGEENQ